jgi:hypothetical protein
MVVSPAGPQYGDPGALDYISLDRRFEDIAGLDLAIHPGTDPRVSRPWIWLAGDAVR